MKNTQKNIILKNPPKNFDTNQVTEKSNDDDFLGIEDYLWSDDLTPIGKKTIACGWNKFYVSNDGISGWGTIENTGYNFYESQQEFEDAVI